MKFTNSPFAILDKNMNALDYQKKIFKYEDYLKSKCRDRPTNQNCLIYFD